MNSAEPTVFIVDDEAAVRRAMVRLLKSAGIPAREYASAEAFFVEHDPGLPGCLLLDLAMPGVDGLEVQRRLAEQGAVRPIIFLSGHADVPTSVRAMKAGAVDFLTKPVNDTVLLCAIHAAFGRDLLARAERTIAEDESRRWALLTPREREVLIHVAAGLLNKQIAAELGTVEQTVKVHRARGLEKLGLSSVPELVHLVERVKGG